MNVIWQDPLLGLKNITMEGNSEMQVGVLGCPTALTCGAGRRDQVTLPQCLRDVGRAVVTQDGHLLIMKPPMMSMSVPSS